MSQSGRYNRLVSLLVSTAIAFVLIGCAEPTSTGLDVGVNSQGSNTCLQVATPALIVSVEIPAGESASQFQQSLTVTASSQNGSVQLLNGEATASTVSYFGAFGNAGNYTVSFSLGGKTSTLSNIVVNQASNGCSVNTVTLNAAIQGDQVTLLP